jgi:hypothetical protein
MHHIDRDDRMKTHCAAALAAGLALFIVVGNSAASCGSAVCMVNTNWGVHGVWNAPGPRVDFRYEYIDQDQPMSGSRRVGVGEIPAHHDEIRTINRNALLTLDYGVTPDWGASVVVPYVDREHRHIHNHRGERIVESWDFARLGDVRVQGRWQFPIETQSETYASFGGLVFGVKLPTGSFRVANDQGAIAERSLQPGTGTTDAILGGYYRVALPLRDLSAFVQVEGQLPIDSRDGYKPGMQAGIDGGLRYEASERLGLMLQLLYRYKARDEGAQAEPEDSGSETVAIAPGASFAITESVQFYGFVQLPLYRHVNGVQLTADWSALAGVSVQF